MIEEVPLKERGGGPRADMKLLLLTSDILAMRPAVEASENRGPPLDDISPGVARIDLDPLSEARTASLPCSLALSACS